MQSTYTLEEILRMSGNCSLSKDLCKIVRICSNTYNYYIKIDDNKYINYDCKTKF